MEVDMGYTVRNGTDSAEQSLRKKRVRNKRVRKVSENWHNFLERVGWRVLKWYGNVERIREYTLTLNSNQVMIFLIYNDAKAKHSVETILLIYNFSLPRLWCIVQNPIVEQWQWATVSHAITRTNNRYMYANKTSSCVCKSCLMLEEEEESNHYWNEIQDNCPAWKQESGNDH